MHSFRYLPCDAHCLTGRQDAPSRCPDFIRRINRAIAIFPAYRGELESAGTTHVKDTLRLSPKRRKNLYVSSLNHHPGDKARGPPQIQYQRFAFDAIPFAFANHVLNPDLPSVATPKQNSNKTC